MEEMTFTELQQKMQLEKKKEGTAKYASRHVEDIYDAFKSLKSNWSVVEAIEQAVSGLYRPDYRRILIEKYLAYPPKPNWQIAQAIGFERTAFQELLNNAILAFAELYRDGKLVVER